MKRTLLFLLLLLAGNTVFAQDYAPLPDTGIRRYFTNSAGYLRGIRVDSVVQESGYKRYVTFRTPRGASSGFSSTHLSDSNGACWIGKNVRAYANGDWHFPNHAGDTIIIKTGAVLNDSWSFYSDTTNRWFEAKVIAVDTQTVFGILDSVKIIELTAKWGNMPLPADSITGFRIVLSKKNGFAEVPDFYLFPYAEINSNWIGIGGRDFWYKKVVETFTTITPSRMVFRQLQSWKPTQQELFDFAVGDAFRSAEQSGQMSTVTGDYTLYDTVLTRQDFPDSTRYTIKRWSSRASNQYQLSVTRKSTITLTVKNTLLLDTLRMPEEYVDHSFNGFYTHAYLFPQDNSFCLNEKLRINLRLRAGQGLYMDDGFLNPEVIQYKKGLGVVYNQWRSEDLEFFKKQLDYHQKGSVVCGTPGQAPSGIPNVQGATIFKIYPHPAGNQVFLEAPQLRYPATIRIQNLQGQLFSTQELSVAGKPISTASLPAGLYLLSVTDAGGNSAVQKLLIEAE